MIKPTIGRIVHYYGNKDLVKYQPLAAVVCFVLTDESVNLSVFNVKGEPFSRERIRLIQDLEKAKETDNLPDGEFCCWMPFQRTQPVIAESIESRLKALEDAGLARVENKLADTGAKVPAGMGGDPAASGSVPAPSPTAPPVKQVTK